MGDPANGHGDCVVELQFVVHALQAVDEVIAFMDRDPGWVEGSRREGRVIYAAKKPHDPQAYAQAQTDAEKRRAYCFCPIIRGHLDQGMPRSFCYCGADWYRRQWEGATGKPVTVDRADDPRRRRRVPVRGPLVRHCVT